MKDMKRHKVGNSNFNIICYADDAVLVAENEEGPQKLLHRLNNTCKQENTVMSPVKTKSMAVAVTAVRCKV